MDSDDETSRRLHVSFVTKLKPPYKIPTTSIAIPSHLTRLGLSTMVNSLLKVENMEWKNEPFDFLIGGELVRMSLEQFLMAKGISAEKTLEIEYIRAVAPRREEEPSLHDDWVSAVDGSCSMFIASGCYDNLGRVWKSAGVCTHILEGHVGVISSVCIVNQEDPKNVTIATASKDGTSRLFKFDATEVEDSPGRIQAYKVLRGHNASVQDVAVQSGGNMVCSGSWDSTINLWRTDVGTEGESVSVKRRKGENQTKDTQSEEEAASTLVGHTQCVSSVIWPERDIIYSASWDHSVRRWDAEMGKDVSHIFCGKALNCIDIGGESSALIAAGGSDPILRIWDPRKPGTSAPVFQFSSHTSWIAACKWHRKSWFHLLSASYDGKVMLWDLRTAWPLSIIDAHKDKVLSADWWNGDSVVSGGADSKLRIFSDISIQ